MSQVYKKLSLIGVLSMSVVLSIAQIGNDSLLQDATLDNIIQYTLLHQPVVQKSLLDEQITRSQVNSRLADWYPQIDFDANMSHYFQLQTTVFQGTVVQLGNNNVATGIFSYTQNIFNSDLLLAASTGRTVRTFSAQTTTNNKIAAVANASKAFYDVILTTQQIRVSEEEITRLQHSVADAKNQYEAGIVDKIDYQRATISLNNAVALKKSNDEALKEKLAYLKSLMGYPAKAALSLKYDSTQMQNEIAYDISQDVDYNNRIEYQLLLTQKKLQQANLSYSKNTFIPSLTGFADYSLNYLNNNVAELYNTNYPNSYIGIGLAFPLVRGGKRIMAIRQAKWQLRKADWDLTDMQSTISTQYAEAMGSYKSSMANYAALKENLTLAQNVYSTIDYQYRSGVKAYLEVIVAESDLRTSEINYFNALNQVLSSKIDLQRALGQLKY
jgi:outer membrane protein